MGRIVVISNAKVGSHESDVIDRVCEIVGSAGPVDRVTGGEDPIVDVAAGADLLVVAGGDGSVHHVVAELESSGVDAPPLAVVPLGTGNDLVRSLGLDPDDPVGAAELAVAGTARPVDLVRWSAGVVVNAAHAGLGAAASEAAAGLKDHLGALAYPVGALIAAVREDGWALEVVADGVVIWSGPTLLVGVGNGRTIGGGTPMFPAARLDDGLVEVVVATGVRARDRAGFGAALRTGAHVDRDDVLVARAGEVEIRGEAVTHNTDGELRDEQVSVDYRVVPSALQIVAAAIG